MTTINNTSLGSSTPLNMEACPEGSPPASLPRPWANHHRVSLQIPPLLPGARVTRLGEIEAKSVSGPGLIRRRSFSDGGAAGPVRANIQALSANSRDPRVTPFNALQREIL